MYNELVSTGVKRAWSSISQFLKLYNLKPELFRHLFELDVKIDNSKSDFNAKYNSKSDNYITIYTSYIENLVDRLNDGTYTKQYVINDIATTIIHEIIHANRSVYVKDGSVCAILSDDSVDPKTVTEDYLNFLLSSVISDEEYFSSYVVVPIRVDYLDNDTYNVYAYNTVTNQYHIYEKQTFKSSNIHEIADELNTNRLRYTPNRTLHCNQKFESIDYSSQEESVLDIEITGSDYLEECLVEMISRFILYSRKSNIYNLDAFVKSVESENTLAEYKLVSKMMSKMGIDVIIWFIFSSYDDFYDEETYKKYKNKFDEIYSEYSKLASENDEIAVNDMVVSVTNILENLN